MSDSGQKAEDNLQVNNPLPFLNKPVWVQCEKFRCMARQDNNGKWKSVFGNTELTTFVKMIDPKDN